MIDPVFDPATDSVRRRLPVVRTEVLRIDCHTCTARPVDCADCVVSFMLGGPPSDGADLDPTEAAALAVLADSGLVPPLRLVTDPAALAPERS